MEWADAQASASLSYEVHASISGGAWTAVAVVAHPTVTANITALLPNTVVQVKVRGTSDQGSTWSNFTPVATLATLPSIEVQLEPQRNSSSGQHSIAVNASLIANSGSADLWGFQCATSQNMSVNLVSNAAAGFSVLIIENLLRYTSYGVWCGIMNRGGSEYSSMTSNLVRTYPNPPGH